MGNETTGCFFFFVISMICCLYKYHVEETGGIQHLRRKGNHQTCVPISCHQTFQHSGTRKDFLLTSSRSSSSACPSPGSGTLFQDCSGEGEGPNMVTGLPGFKSKVTQQLVKVTPWLCDPGQVTSFPHLCNKGGDGTYIPGL